MHKSCSTPFITQTRYPPQSRAVALSILAFPLLKTHPHSVSCGKLTISCKRTIKTTFCATEEIQEFNTLDVLLFQRQTRIAYVLDLNFSISSVQC